MNKVDGSPAGSEYSNSGLLALTSANIGWGIADVCITIIGRGQVVTWIHGITGAIFLLTISIFLGGKFSWKDFISSFPIGLQRAVVWSAIFIAFQEDNPSIAITVISFSLVVSIVVFGPKLGEKLTPKILVLAFIGSIGLLLTSVKSFTDFELSKGAIISLLVLPVMSAGTYILRNVQKKVPAKTAPVYMYAWIALLTSFLIPFSNPRFDFTNHEIFVLVVLMVFGAGGHYLFNYSQPRTSFRFNAIASTVHTPATAIFTWWFIGGTLNFQQILGMVIVTVVVAYMSISAKRPEVQEFEESLSPEI